MTTNPSLDFGYPWWLSYGHLAISGATIGLSLLAARLHWPNWLRLTLGATALWAAAVFLLVQFGLGINTVQPLPTQNFFQSGSGRVLDIGAGTGRSSIMLLAARPNATLVASDLFGDSFDHHFGHSDSPQQILQKNLAAAGVANRATIATADMRKLPFDDASFDAALSAYAVDHLSRDGSKQALAEARRVLKPGGEFLLMLVENEAWAKLAFGPLLSHGGTRGRPWWTGAAKDAGFEILEAGTKPATLYLLLRRPPGATERNPTSSPTAASPGR
jgi:SAM-dependent methyltransferase